MKKLVIIATILGTLGPATLRLHAQGYGVFLSGGVATMRMDDMKYLLESIMDTYPVDARVISSFPPFTSVSVGFMKRSYPHLKLGAGYGYTTSGAKGNYTDHSGSLTTEITAISHQLGGIFGYSPLTGDRVEFSLLGRVHLNMTRMNVSTLLIASGYSSGFDTKYTSFSPQVSGLAELLYHTGKFSLGVEGGYLIDIPGKLKSGGGSELADPADPRTTLTSDWTGWRIGIKGILWLEPEGD
jgi:hypothetical protein